MRGDTRGLRAAWRRLVGLGALLSVVAGTAIALDRAAITDEYIRSLENVDPTGRVVFKLDRDSGLIVEDGRILSTGGGPNAEARDVQAMVTSEPGAQLLRLFRRSTADLDAERRRAESRVAKRLPNLNTYGVLAFDRPMERAELIRIVRALNADPRIEVAHPESRAVSTQVEPGAPDAGGLGRSSATPSFEHLQGYLGSESLGGVNALWARTFAVPGARGANVGVLDLEGAWLVDHEDMPPGFYTIHPFDQGECDGSSCCSPSTQITLERHGTSTIGVMGAPDNGYGVTGIAPDATYGGLGVAGLWTCGGSIPNDISEATALLNPGDVIVLELQRGTFDPQNGLTWLPVEWIQSSFDAIEISVAAGINVVEAAGNGYRSGGHEFGVDIGDYGVTEDSGAIMVAGADPAGVPDTQFNWGDRINVNAWSRGVTTLHGGDLQGAPLPVQEWYRGGYAGTSSATSIVGGATVAISGGYEAAFAAPADPGTLRDAMVQMGTPAQPGVHVGSRPDIRGALWLLTDLTPPPAITNLASTDQGPTFVDLFWTAPTDFYDLAGDGYDIRYSTSLITAGNFDSATPATQSIVPAPAGQPETFRLGSLSTNTTYYVAIKTSSPSGLSDISNVLQVTTLPSGPVAELNPSVLELGDAELGHTVSGTVLVENPGTEELTVFSFTVTDLGSASFAVSDGGPFAVAAGGFYPVEVSGTASATELAYGLLTVASNDPGPSTQGVASVSGVTVTSDPDPIAETVCDGNTRDGSVDLTLDGTDTAGWTVWAEESGNGNPLPDPSAPYAALDGMLLLVDMAHGNTSIGGVLALGTEVTMRGGAVTWITNPFTPEILADAHVVWVQQSQSAWSVEEKAALADFVNGGGGVIVESGFFVDFHDELLDAMGSGIELGISFDDPYTGPTANITREGPTNGVTSLDLAIGFTYVSALSGNAGELFREDRGGGLPDRVKAAYDEVGAGRVVAIADNVILGNLAGADARIFANRTVDWLAKRAAWMSVSPTSGTFDEGVPFALDYTVDASFLPQGGYAGNLVVDPDVPGRGIRIPVSVNVTPFADVQIDNVQFLVGVCDQTTVKWTTTIATTGQLDWGLAGGPLNNTETSPLGTSHSVVIPTSQNTSYDGLITANVPGCQTLQEAVAWATQRFCAPPPLRTPDRPDVVTLAGVSPNPFNPTTTISFGLPAQTDVRMLLFDTSGRRVRSLLEDSRGPGWHQVTWDGRSDGGARVASGVYYLVFDAGRVSERTKLVLLK